MQPKVLHATAGSIHGIKSLQIVLSYSTAIDQMLHMGPDLRLNNW